MSDITMAAQQAEVEDSLLSAPVVMQLPHTGEWHAAEGQETETDEHDQRNSLFEDSIGLLNEAVREQSGRYGDDAVETEDQEQQPAQAERQIRADYRVQETHAEQEPQQPLPEPTAGDVQKALSAFDATAQEYGLTQDRGAFTSELASLFNMTAHEAGLHVEALEKPLERAFISSFDVYVGNRNNLAALPPIADTAAKSFAYDFLEGLGQDPRAISNLDHQTLASAVLAANLSIFQTYEQSGGMTDVKRLNDPRISEGYVNAILGAIGGKPVSREKAVAIADRYTAYVLRNVQRVQQRQASMQQNAPARAGRRGATRIPRGMGPGIRGERAPRFTSNTDIFTPGVVAAATTQRL